MNLNSGTESTSAETPAGPGAGGTPAGPGATTAARVVTDVLQPRNVLVLGLPGIGLAASGHWTGLLWGLLGALGAGLIPAAYIEWERRRGTWGDRHVVERTQRPPIFYVILGSIGISSLLMLLTGAPTPIMAAMLSLWVMTIALLAVNTVWKISVDSAVASAVVALLAVAHSPWWLLAYALTVAVCWSRVALNYHTTAQTLAGASLGAVTAAGYLLA
jgi:hypothetical protein